MKDWVRKYGMAAVAIVLAVANAGVWFVLWSGPGTLVVTFLDVGQGDAIVILVTVSDAERGLSWIDSASPSSSGVIA